ncbi:MAG TPA: hypothetical protein VGC69_03730 [Bordetella sp.]
MRGLVFADVSGEPSKKPQPTTPFLVTREDIDAEIARLADIARQANGRRASKIVHPAASDGMLSLTPSTDVAIQVLKPGEETLDYRSNANEIEICIRGSGRVIAADATHEVGRFDVWNIPAMRVHRYKNTGSDLWVRLTYSNAPLLEKLAVFFSEEGDEIKSQETRQDGLSPVTKKKYSREEAPDMPIGSEGARLRGYEFLTDIEVVENKTLLWRWQDVRPYLPMRVGDGHRPIWLLYNPATEKRAGTNNSFFATWTGAVPGMPPFAGKRGHRHTSASINYHASGHGTSVVDGVTVEWKAGDLLFSAPGWSEHAHYFGSDGWEVLTIQEHPMHIALGSLLWQEKIDGPIYALGAERGQAGYQGPREVGA